MLREVDLSLKPLHPKLYLCKPNGTTTDSLVDASNINYQNKLGATNEISFEIPYEKDVLHKLVRNKSSDNIKERFLIRLELGKDKELFIINKITENMSSDKDTKIVTAYSLGYELADKIINGLEVTSKNASEILDQALTYTLWSVGYVDSDFDIKYRSFEVSEKTVLDFVFEVAEVYGAVVEFDTLNRVINFKKHENIGQNKGLTFSYSKYAKSIEKNSSTDEMVTRLYVYGKEGMSIHRVNPTGTNYIESFEYFLYPFQQDEAGNVIQSSAYMSDELCKAILQYSDLLETKKGEFSTLLTQKENLLDDLFTKQNEMSTLEEEYKVILDQLAVANASGNDTSTILQNKANKESEIASKQSEIDAITSQMDSIDSQIIALQSEISIENNFTPELIKERNQYIIEKTWSDENHYDDQELYEAAIKRFDNMKKPQLVLNIDIVNFLAIVEEQRNWNKLSLGDTVTIRYEKFNLNVQAKIIEINYDFENSDIKLTIANVKEIESDQDFLIKKIYSAHSTSTKLEMKEYKYEEAYKNLGTINDIINNTWDATKREIQAGVNNSVSISGRGIIIEDPDNPMNQLIAQAGVIAISNSGGNDYKNAITKDGIVGERIFGKILAGVNLSIENDAGKFTFDSNGVVIDGSSFMITGGENGIQLDTDNGLTVTRSDEKVKTILNATDGITIQKYESGTGQWNNKFYVDTDGTLNAEELITRKIKIKDGSDQLLIDADTRTINFDNFQTKVGKLSAENIDATSITVDSANINGTIYADQLNLAGIDVRSAITGLQSFYIPPNGDSANLLIRGNIIMQGGEIRWENVAAPAYDDINGTKPAKNADNTMASIGNTYLTKLTSTGVYTGTVSADNIIGNTFYVGNNYTNTKLMLFTSDTGQHRIYSNQAGGFRLESDGSLSLMANSNYGVYVTNAPLVCDTGLRVTGTTQLNSPVTVNSSLNAVSLKISGQDAATESWVATNFEPSSSNLVKWAETYRIPRGGASLKFIYGAATIQARTYSDSGWGNFEGLAYSNVSKREYKRDIESFEGDALQSILDTQVYSYRYNEDLDSEPKRIGLIYEESPMEIMQFSGGIDIYAMSSMNWRGLQQLNQKHEDKYNDLNDKYEALKQQLIDEGVLQG